MFRWPLSFRTSLYPGNFRPPGQCISDNPDYKTGSNGKVATYGGKVTDHDFPNILVSKRGYTQTDSAKLTNTKSQIGMGTRVDFVANTQTCVFNNSNGEKVSVVNAFAVIDYGTEVVFDLTTKKHK